MLLFIHQHPITYCLMLMLTINFSSLMLTRGGVEDTRLEAKAKDTKKSEAKAKDSLSEDRTSRGQGQECSRPRTRDTGASVLQKKKKRLQKFFSGNLQFIAVPRIFDWGRSKAHEMTSSKFFQRGSFCGTNIL